MPVHCQRIVYCDGCVEVTTLGRTYSRFMKSTYRSRELSSDFPISAFNRQTICAVMFSKQRKNGTIKEWENDKMRE